MPHDTRDEIVDWIRRWSERAEIAALRFVRWIGISESKYHSWRGRYGRVNEHNSWIPRDHWLESWEREAIVEYWNAHPLEGYRRCTFMSIRPPDPILLDDFGSRMISVSFTRRRSSTWAVPTSRRRFAGSTGRG